MKTLSEDEIKEMMKITEEDLEKLALAIDFLSEEIEIIRDYTPQLLTDRKYLLTELLLINSKLQDCMIYFNNLLQLAVDTD